MKEDERYNGKGRYIIIRFIEMLFILLMMQRSASTSCRHHVCLTWKIHDLNLVLICKVDALNLPVTFYDPFNNETGFCVPHAPCHSLLHKGFIEKNSTVDEIIFTIPLKTELNGWWTCQYGDNNVRAVTEVTLQDVPANSNTFSETRNSFECWTLQMLWCVFGFTCTYLFGRFVIFVFTFLKKDLAQVISTKVESIVNCSPSATSYDSGSRPKSDRKYVVAFILSSTLFILPVAVGLIEEKQCKAARFFPYYGAIVGFLCCFLLINIDKSKAKKTGNSNGGTENIPMVIQESHTRITET